MGFTHEEAVHRASEIEKTRAWSREKLAQGTKFEKVAKFGPIIQIISVMAVLFTFVLFLISSVITFYRSNKLFSLIWFCSIIIFSTIGAVLNHFYIQNETYYRLKRQEEWYQRAMKALEVEEKSGNE